MKQANDARAGRRLILKSLAAAPLAAFAAACELPVPGQGPPPILYRLTPKSTFREDLPTVSWQLVLEPPLANAALSTTRIALYRDPTNLAYYARASWIDRAPNMVQTLMIESFENSGKIVAVGRESIGLRSDFVLKAELREFQAEYHGGDLPTAHVAINAKLVQSATRTIIGSQSFDSRFEANADSRDAIIEAFDEALGKAMKRLVEWTLLTGEEAYRRRRGA